MQRFTGIVTHRGVETDGTGRERSGHDHVQRTTSESNAGHPAEVGKEPVSDRGANGKVWLACIGRSLSPLGERDSETAYRRIAVHCKSVRREVARIATRQIYFEKLIRSVLTPSNTMCIIDLSRLCQFNKLRPIGRRSNVTVRAVLMGLF